MELSLAASVREGLGKQQVIKLRQKGEVPAVLYGEGKENEHLTLDAHELRNFFLKGGAGKLISLKIKKGKKEEQQHVLIKELQKHPLKGNVIHVDFLRVAMDHLVTIKIPVHLVNEEKRAKDGAVLELVLHELEVSCLPANIPDRISVDVSKLALGTGIHVKDLALAEGVKVLNSADEAVVMAAAPTAAAIPEPAAPAAEANAATPEAAAGAKKE
ncbi:MAG TPA: 50S ribosomal protein L25 [Firmicutes bacterium]|jgi:large subunit ribosomal protein L25|nr:50S ribosomal protein L25 [Bacillota bacterium]